MSLLVAESLLFPVAASRLFIPMALFLLLVLWGVLCLFAALAGEGGSRRAWGLVRWLSMGPLVVVSRAGSGGPLRLVQARWASRSRAWRMGEATEGSSSTRAPWRGQRTQCEQAGRMTTGKLLLPSDYWCSNSQRMHERWMCMLENITSSSYSKLDVVRSLLGDHCI